MKNVIEVENVSKKYILYHKNRGYNTLVETISNNIRSSINKFINPSQNTKKLEQEEFWSLKNINFTIEEGDRVGIIGRNGAGKSTLLKVLSRITEPTTGKIKIKGRVASLLEVGTGFHLELTGRENIFLNGAILGMKHQEIRSKFDEIVDFAEIEKFLDTPVKRYSSGMYMRLGFAIAAHVDPDLLIVDEVLSVGDSSFQDKCLKKLNHLGSSGRTILYVSHNVGTVLNICNKGIFLEKGQLRKQGNIDECVSEYVRSCQIWSMHWSGDIGDEHIRIQRATLQTHNKDFFYQGEEAILSLEYEILKPTPELCFGICIWNQRNQPIARSRFDYDSEFFHSYTTSGKHRLSFPINTSLFHEGEYIIKVDAGVYNNRTITHDDIILKLPIYSSNKNAKFSHMVPKEGVLLNNRWQKETKAIST